MQCNVYMVCMVCMVWYVWCLWYVWYGMYGMYGMYVSLVYLLVCLWSPPISPIRTLLSIMTCAHSFVPRLDLPNPSCHVKVNFLSWQPRSKGDFAPHLFPYAIVWINILEAPTQLQALHGKWPSRSTEDAMQYRPGECNVKHLLDASHSTLNWRLIWPDA